MSELTTDGIDRLEATPLPFPGGWRITFRSVHEGLRHQLYVNGALAGWTDAPQERSFLLPAGRAPRQVAVAAVPPELRRVDMAAQLPAEGSRPAWAIRLAVARSPRHGRAARLLLLTDHASGMLDPASLDARQAWPEWAPRWAWGEDAFGQGGFGYDGSAGPGLGEGAFGAGLFGVDERLIRLEGLLTEDGEHRIVVRTITPDGLHADAPARFVTVHPPPVPAAALRATAYDAQAGTLTLEIETR